MMGIVNDDELELELNRLNKIQVPTIIDIHKGRGQGSVEVPESLRKIIGETNEIDGRTKANKLAKMFDISSSSVSAYANGSTSTASYHKPDKDLLNHITKAKERISKKARMKLNRALDHITDEKLEQAKPEVLAGVARNMSAIVKDLEPSPIQGNGINTNVGAQFIFYSPIMRKEESFDVLDCQSE